MKGDLVKAGEFMGCPIYIDTAMSPYEDKVISARWDAFAQQIVRNEVRLINLAPLDDLKRYRKP